MVILTIRSQLPSQRIEFGFEKISTLFRNDVLGKYSPSCPVVAKPFSGERLDSILKRSFRLFAIQQAARRRAVSLSVVYQKG